MIGKNIHFLLKLKKTKLFFQYRNAASSLLNEFTETLKLMGPGLLSQSFDTPLNGGASLYLDVLAVQILEILKKEHVCQSDSENLEEQSQEDDDQCEQDALVISSAADTVGALASVFGPSFSIYFQKIFPLIAKYYKPCRPDVDRNMAIGSIAEVAAGLGPGVTEFTTELFQLFVKGLTDDEEEVKSNSAYGLGILCEHSRLDLTSHYMQLLQLLSPFFNKQDSKTNITDNVCGAVARMILRNPERVPLEQVLPIFMKSLPLKKDFQENEPVYRCIFTLLKANNAFVSFFLFLSNFFLNKMVLVDSSYDGTCFYFCSNSLSRRTIK
jgi:hypothetical protein